MKIHRPERRPSPPDQSDTRGDLGDQELDGLLERLAQLTIIPRPDVIIHALELLQTTLSSQSPPEDKTSE